MFWRFGFHNASTIDSLLDKEDVVLEAILDEDDLIQECKAQNTRLIDYFGRIDVLHKLLGYVTGQIESEEKGMFKYPYIATEVLCCEIWSIVDTCMNEQQQLLVPFWEIVLDKSPDEMKTQMIMASHFAKINSVFLAKKPAEMLEFIQAQPSIVDRLLKHIESPAFVDLIGRILQLDETISNCNVIEWLSSQNFMGRLVTMLSSSYSPSIHSIVSDLLKTIISLATPSPGAGITDSLQNGPASNLLVREIASKKKAETLVDYMLFDFSQDVCNTPTALERENKFKTGELEPEYETEDCSLPSPTYDSSISSIVQSMGLLVELIRKNNSDYFEPYLFHTLRNRLIQVQQHSHLSGDDIREALENVMREMVDRMGVVHLGPMLQVLAGRLGEFQKYLRVPRSSQGPINTTIGPMTPFTLERYRIVELYAEILHCSNMSLLNRPPNYMQMYDSEGRLQGGLAGLEELANVIALNGSYRTGEGAGGGDGDGVGIDERDEIDSALDFPIHGAGSGGDEMLGSDDDEGMTSEDEPGSSDDEAMEEIAMYDEPPSDVRSSPLPVHDGGLFSSLSEAGGVVGNATSPSIADARGPESRTAKNGTLPGSNPDPFLSPPPGLISHPSSSPSFKSNPQGSRRSSRSRRRMTMDNSSESLMVVGENMKKKLLDEGVVGMIVDLFFQYPWNNFLHSAVYDFLHQVLTGRVDSGYNRELIISLFRDAKILHRIVEGQAKNDIESSKPKGVRLGYMGHLMLISEDVITALARFPPDLRLIIIQYAPEPEWDQYVTGRYNETKQEDARLLGGGKPVVTGKAARGGGVMQWKVDEDDLGVDGGGGGGGGNGNGSGGVRGEFRRASSVGPSSGAVTSTADFGPAPMDEDEDEDDDNVSPGRAPHFARYLAQEISSDHFGSSSSDDDDEDEGWLTQSTFNSIGNAPVPTHPFGERRPLSRVSGFDNSFDPGSVSLAMAQDPFSPHDDDGFGPFSDPTGGTVSDSLTFSSFSDEDSFESFGEFGDFQTAEDGELTPTSGSWTFANEGGGSVDSGASSGGGGGGSDVEGGSSSSLTSSSLTR